MEGCIPKSKSHQTYTGKFANPKACGVHANPANPVPILYPKTKELSAGSAKLLKRWGGIPELNR